MKRKGVILTLSLLLPVMIMIAGRTALAVVGVKGTKHDLSTGGPGPIKAASGGTSEICVFCHTPHGAAAISGTNAPLWNKNITSDPSYTVYTSDVLSQLNYPAAEAPALTGKAVHLLNTRLCLSCHDGTIALGALANLPNGFTLDITMTGTGADYKMPSTAVGFIGVDMRDDHPVAIPLATVSDPELTAPALASKVKLFADSGNNYVECTSCHDPHDNTNGNFLVETNKNSALCERCHPGSQKAGFEGTPNSAHADTSILVPYAPSLGSTPPDTHGPYVGNVRCMNCHFPHKTGINNTATLPQAPPADLTTYPKLGRYLLTFQEEMSCYNEKDRWGDTPVTACHGSGGAGKDIKDESASSKPSGHRVGNFAGKHEATEDRDPNNPTVPKSNWVNTGGVNWHVQCYDCHNPHTARRVNHITSSQRGTANGNAVLSSSPLYGAGGWDPGLWPTWAGGLGSYSYIEPAGLINATVTTVTKEYQLCFRCHSYQAWTNNPPTSPSMSPPAAMTDQAKEFNTADSVSYHPVVQNTGTAPHNPAAPQGTLLAPWSTKGTQTMYCSDCHTKEGDGTPTGPHGSTNAFILRTAFADTITGVGTDQPNDLCSGCHDPNTYNASGADGNNVTGTGFSNGTTINLHNRHKTLASSSLLSNKGYRCVNCHAKIPHGYSRKAMIVVGGVGGDTYAAAYSPVGGPLIVTPTALPASQGYTTRDAHCSTIAGCHHNP